MQKDTDGFIRFRGIPSAMLPRKGTAPARLNRFEIVEEGPRDLAVRPFDYRNPFPLLSQKDIAAHQPNGPQTIPLEWPLSGEDPAAFDYYCNDNAAIGLPGGPHCALVDLHGTLRSFAGAWALGFGEQALPPRVRVRQLREGWIPVVEAACAADHVRARLSWFTAEIPGTSAVQYPMAGNGSYQWVGGTAPSGRNLFHRIQCLVENAAGAAMPVSVYLGYAQAGALCSGAFYTNPRHAPAWDKVWWQRRAAGDMALLARHDKETVCLGLLFAEGWTFRPGNTRIQHWPRPIPSSPVRQAQSGAILKRSLLPGASARIGMWIPEFPVPLSDVPRLAKADAAALERSTVRMWRTRHAKRPAFLIPEAKVDHAFRQALNHLDMLSVAVGATEYLTPGPNGGHHVFYDRDSADMIHAFDLVGEASRVETMLDHYWLRNVGQEESGMILWQLGKHFDLTQDRGWAERMFPMAIRCMTNLIRLWTDHQTEHGGLLPPSAVGDNELAKGRYVSYHLYAVAGARNGARLAAVLRKEPLATEWTAFAAMFERLVVRRLEELGRLTGGVITPTFEGFAAAPVTVDITWETPPRKHTYSGAFGKTGGCDWHNLGAVFPTGVLPPHHPLVSSSLARWRHMYVEGDFPYPFDNNYARLHNYNGMNLSGAWLRRGDWAETVRDLYGVLLHTSATHASAEVVNSAIRMDYNCTPHNWFSGKLVRFVRDLLVYEDQDGRLHLLGGLSPAWMKPGMVVGVNGAPTDYGTLSYSATLRTAGMTLAIRLLPRKDARGLVLHLPPFLHSVKVTADGRRCKAVKGCWTLPVSTRKVDVCWAEHPLPDISFLRVVESYLADHARRVAAREQTGHQKNARNRAEIL